MDMFSNTKQLLEELSDEDKEKLKAQLLKVDSPETSRTIKRIETP